MRVEIASVRHRTLRQFAHLWLKRERACGGLPRMSDWMFLDSFTRSSQIAASAVRAGLRCRANWQSGCANSHIKCFSVRKREPMKFKSTATTICVPLYNGFIPEANASFLSNEEALVKPVTDNPLAAGQPAPLNANMKSEVRKLVELLKLDPGYPTSKDPLVLYVPAGHRPCNENRRFTRLRTPHPPSSSWHGTCSWETGSLHTRTRRCRRPRAWRAHGAGQRPHPSLRSSRYRRNRSR